MTMTDEERKERTAEIIDANKFRLFDENKLLREVLAEIRDLAYRGVGSPTDALSAIQERASWALTEVER